MRSGVDLGSRLNEVGTDPKTIQIILRHANPTRPKRFTFCLTGRISGLR